MNNDSDIRPALRNRLAAIDAELIELTRRRETLATLRKSIEQTLANEDALAGEDDGILPLPAGVPGTGLAVQILGVLDSGPKTLDQLKTAGAGWPLLKGHDSPGRAINFALVGMLKGGHVERLTDGKWRKK